MLHLELSEGSSVHKIPLYTVKDGKSEGGVTTLPTMITSERGRGLWSGAYRNEVTFFTYEPDRN